MCNRSTTIISLKLWPHLPGVNELTHWGRVTHMCVSKLTTIGSDNGLSPGRRQAIIWTNDGILLIRTLGKNFSEILNEIHAFSFKKMHSKMSSAKWRLFRLGLNELTHWPVVTTCGGMGLHLELFRCVPPCHYLDQWWIVVISPWKTWMWF